MVPHRRKRIVHAFTVLLLVTAALAVACLDLVDYEPYFQQSCYAATTERLQNLSRTNHAITADLFAGFGRARLTPELPAASDSPAEGRFRQIPLAGYGDRRGRPATGTHDDLFVKALAFQVGGLTGIVFSADALIVPREVADAAAGALRTRHGLQRPQLYFSATHTHCSIGGWGEGYVGEVFAGEFNPGARAWFASRLVAAAEMALADLKPAELAYGSFHEPRFVRNRLLPTIGQVNSSFHFTAVRQIEGASAILGSYPAHATVLSSEVMEFSGDYPGFWQRAVEQATGGHALFLAGPVGSHGPVPGERGFAGAERMGTLLAQPLIERLPHLRYTNRITFALAGVDLSLPELQVRVTRHVRLRPWLSGYFLRVPGRESFVQALRLDGMMWISTPCDYSGELALEASPFLAVRGYETAITSFNGDYIGYIVPSRYYHMDGYEPRVMSFYGPGMAPYLQEVIRSLALSLDR